MLFEIRRGKQTERFRGDRLRVGTHASTDLVLDDPLAAKLHLTFTGGPQGLELVPEATSTGTYVDGEAVEGRRALAVGATLVVGTTRLTVEALDAAAGTVTIAVDERSFFHTAKRRGEFHSDADEWVRSEVRFGRMPLLRRLNALVAGVGLLLFAAWLTWPSFTTRQWISPGPLSDAHAELFRRFEAAGGDLTDPRLAGYSADVLAAAAEGCAACHEDGSVEVTGCGSCHGDLVDPWMEAEFGDDRLEGRHPFGIPSPADCLECHDEHEDAERPIHGHFERGDGCATCHHEPGQADRLVELANAKVSGEATATLWESSGAFAGFDHRAHLDVGCSECHVRVSDPGGAGRDFQRPTFETCHRCHSSDRVPADDRDLRIALSPDGHGNLGESCTRCHAVPFSPALALVELGGSMAPRQFDLAWRSHDEFHHDPPIDGRACTDCHLKPTDAAYEGLRTESFSHAVHLVPPTGDDDEALAAFSEQCVACHGSTAGSADLARERWEDPEVLRSGACGQCHSGPDGGSLVQRARSSRAAAPLEVPAFSHAGHANVPGSCAACHTGIGAAAAGESFATPGPATRSCRDCHLEPTAGGGLRHAPLAGLAECQLCHPAEQAQRLSSVFYGLTDRLADRDRRVSGFSHEVHDQECITCHLVPDGGGAIQNPEGTARDCRLCHRKNRYHW